jgi:hypothetical protein
VGAVAEWFVGGVLAAAEVGGFGFSGLEFNGGESGAGVAAVTEWLAGAAAAGAPEIAFAGFEFDRVRAFLCDDGVCHREKSSGCGNELIIADHGLIAVRVAKWLQGENFAVPRFRCTIPT